MTRFITIILLCFALGTIRAQDSARVEPGHLLNHEIGFNTVLLVKQLISNNPTNTLSQSPYVVFYNLYYKDMVGLRIGAGISNSTNKTKIDDQPFPRKTTVNSTDLRVGFSYNFLQKGPLTFNCFADYIIESHKVSTINTTTVQVSPNPVEEQTITTEDKTTGAGGQIGVGLKYNLLKNLSIYAELPFLFVNEKVSSRVNIHSDSGIPDDETISTSTTTGSRFIIPTTIYLVLRF